MTFWSLRSLLQLPAFSVTWAIFIFVTCGDARLIHRYGFEGFETTAIDSVGQKHGSFEGGAKLTGSGSIRLDGVNDFVGLPSGLLSSHQDLTLETWVTWDGPESESWARILEFGKDDRNYLYLTPRTGSSPLHARFGIATNGPEKKVNAVDQLPGDGKTMSHLVVSIQQGSSMATFYLDGEIQGTTSMPAVLAEFPDENAWLGRSHYSWVPPFDGQIHEFRIYD
ncbi:MAG: LamG domain-containing protein, partial [Opitutae bacterium]